MDPHHSTWTSPVFVTKKQRGTTRYIVSFCHLNSPKKGFWERIKQLFLRKQ